MTPSDSDWQQLWSEVVPMTHHEPRYRLYHDDQGQPLFYSMESQPGNYIDITPEQFAAADSHVRVVNGQLVKAQRRSTKKLVVSADQSGTACSVHSVTIVTDKQPVRYWKLKSHEQN